MQRRHARPEQLHLELQYDYLKWLDNTGEEFNFYETITAGFIKTPPLTMGAGDSLYWKEAANMPDLAIRF